jgi:hypothetical protein
VSFIVQPQTLLSISAKRSFGLSNQLFLGYQQSLVFAGYVTLTENTIDEIEITRQPVQTGAAITDHAFKKPVTFSAQILFQSSIGGSLGFTSSAPVGQFGAGGSLPATYAKLLALQSSFMPFTVTTPKRTYNNMLLRTLGLTTDKKTENILAINIAFEEVILVPVVVGIVPKSQLKSPGKNAANKPVPVKSALKQLVEAAQAIAGTLLK